MKKFGKLRQWTDERLGGSQKTIATEEFREMEVEINSRQQGLEAIHQASTVWMKALGKQKKSDSQEALKGTPLDLLGIALFQHGEEFASESAYGQTLVQFGIAQQKIARLQDTFQEKVSAQILLNMERSLAAMREYQTARKKLESRRLTYDSTLSKMQKAKKEDSKVEEELRAARIRYEELQNDVQQRMLAIRQGETGNMRDLAHFIDAQADYYHESSQVMADLQEILLQRVSGSLAGRTTSTVEDSLLSEDEASFSRLRPQQRTNIAQLSTPASRPVSTILASDTDPPESSFSSSSIQTPNPASRKPSVSRQITKSTISSPVQSARPQRKTMIANFDFDAEKPSDLAFRRGDLIRVLEEAESGWWTGEIIDINGQPQSGQGLFPANYCSDHVVKQKRGVASQSPLRLSSYEETPLVKIQSDNTWTSSQFGCTSALESVTVTHRRAPPPPVPKKKQGMSPLTHGAR